MASVMSGLQFSFSRCPIRRDLDTASANKLMRDKIEEDSRAVAFFRLANPDASSLLTYVSISLILCDFFFFLDSALPNGWTICDSIVSVMMEAESNIRGGTY